MPYKFTGDFEVLSKFGFVQNEFKTYWYLPDSYRFNCMLITLDRNVEYYKEGIIDVYIKEVKKDEDKFSTGSR